MTATKDNGAVTGGGAESAGSRIIVHPTLGPQNGLDVTDALVGALANELLRVHGGNHVLNWIEAERLLLDAVQRG
jgi:hypothetical protein